MTDLSKLRIAGTGGESQPTSQDAERLKYLHTYYCATGRLVDTSYDDWIANIDAMKESKT